MCGRKQKLFTEKASRALSIRRGALRMLEARKRRAVSQRMAESYHQSSLSK